MFVDDRTKDSSSSSSSSWGQVSFIRRRLFCARRGERKRERHTRILWIGDGQRGADERSRVESRPGEIETAQTGGTEATVNGNYSGWSLNETCFFQILLACSLARSLASRPVPQCCTVVARSRVHRMLPVRASWLGSSEPGTGSPRYNSFHRFVNAPIVPSNWIIDEIRFSFVPDHQTLRATVYFSLLSLDR